MSEPSSLEVWGRERAPQTVWSNVAACPSENVKITTNVYQNVIKIQNVEYKKFERVKDVFRAQVGFIENF